MKTPHGTARAKRRLKDGTTLFAGAPARLNQRHEWDLDGCCIICGFDGAEWHHWKHHTYEGIADDSATLPPCNHGW